MYIWVTLLDRLLFECNYQGFIFQGHGKSEGPRAYAVSMEHVICQFDFLSLPLVQIICERYLCFLPNDWQVEQDILRHCGFLKSRYPGVPIFIYGDFITQHHSTLPHLIQSLTRVLISRKSREEMTHVFLSRVGELYFHFSFSSRFSNF